MLFLLKYHLETHKMVKLATTPNLEGPKSNLFYSLYILIIDLPIMLICCQDKRDYGLF